MSRPRLLIAIPVTSLIRQKVETLPAAWGNVGRSVGWSPTEELHVTVLYFGEVPTTDWMTICRCVEKVAAMIIPFGIRITGLGAFPNLRRPRVIYAGLSEGAQELMQLHDALSDQLEKQGFYLRDEPNYKPHLTIGRITSDINPELVAQELLNWKVWDGGLMTAGELTIFSSEQRKGRYEYTVVGRYLLDG